MDVATDGITLPAVNPARFARFARARRVGMAALVAAACGACGSTRLYDGPERSRGELAVISGDRAGLGDILSETGKLLAGGSSLHTNIVDIDGREVGFFQNDHVAVLPGRHAVRVKVTLQTAAGIMNDPGGSVTFDAAAGGDYEILARSADHVLPFGLDVVDTQSRTVVASNEPRADECVTADIAWPGPHWIVVDWGRNGEMLTVSYLPPGASLQDWSEIVETQYVPMETAPDLQKLYEETMEGRDDLGIQMERTVIEATPSRVVYSYTSRDPETEIAEQGLTLQRTVPGGWQSFTYALHGELDVGAIDAWSRRFRDAVGRTPGPR